MAQQRIIIDAPPLESEAWATQLFEQLGVTVVSNKALSRDMGKDEAARKALLATQDPVRDAEKLAPHYLRAFEAKHGQDARVGLWGTAWLVYAPDISAVIIDWDEVERRATPPADAKLSEPERASYAEFRRAARDFVHARLKRHVESRRVLELETGLEAAEKVRRGLDFIRALGLS